MLHLQVAENLDEVEKTLYTFLADFNMISKKKMDLVLFRCDILPLAQIAKRFYLSNPGLGKMSVTPRNVIILLMTIQKDII